MLKRVTMLFVSAIFCVSIAGCDKKATSTEDSEKIQVVASFHAVKEITTLVGGDKVDIVSIVPSGTEAHDFEPKASDIKRIAGADIFIYNGLGMEEWVDDALNSAQNSELQIINLSKSSDLIKLSDEEQNHVDMEDTSENKEDHKHGEYDPHIWLSIKEVEKSILTIKDKLVEEDPENKSYYEENYNKNVKRLQDIYEEYKAKFDGLNNKSFIAGHEAFGYLCRDFSLKQIGVEDAFASGDPSPAKLKALVDYVKENKVKTIFSEEAASSKISDTLAKEVGATVKPLVTFENSGSYIDDMRKNLDIIYEGIK
ncbi:metal ABC transporter solute-binding protein, Zn/Mn family [Clostridium cellulovorans]|uniref:Periplasmic solute binding protein n=1 Tax=Clostridium cellulovorans (strain ATCC 35296 / DSM 3052 / OCM 3 / 743B) TaxID=573061 RepID=D9SMQ3_CLOC7|nr:zinc ABC transporter substrate-binding protein [Clostridium cellulovorans]ADL49838.1 periplasmic solute binding protein [Clostridium cellulovorans 743B]